MSEVKEETYYWYDHPSNYDLETGDTLYVKTDNITDAIVFYQMVLNEDIDISKVVKLEEDLAENLKNI